MGRRALWARAEGAQARVVRTDLDTLLTALYVSIDDHLAPRARAGRQPRLTDSELLTACRGLLLIADKGYVSVELDDHLHARGADLLRPSYRNRAPRPGQALLAPIRQLIESVSDTLTGQLDLELHGGRSLVGVATPVARQLPALTAAIWHNPATGQPVTRSLIAYDH